MEQFTKQSIVTTLETAAAKELHSLHSIFAGLYDGNIKVWVSNQVKAFIDLNGSKLLAEAQAFIAAGLPTLLSHLTPFVPAPMQLYIPELSLYVTTEVEHLVAYEFGRYTAPTV